MKKKGSKRGKRLSPGEIEVVVHRWEPLDKDDCGLRVELFRGDEKGRPVLQELKSAEPEILRTTIRTRTERTRMSCPAKVMTFTHL